MEQPTQEQIKEFWEGWGLAEQTTGSWYVDEVGGEYVCCELPPIDLNNLFRYAFTAAVRKLTDDHNYAESYAITTIMQSWMLEAGDNIPDALALFWVLDKIRKEED